MGHATTALTVTETGGGSCCCMMGPRKMSTVGPIKRAGFVPLEKMCMSSIVDKEELVEHASKHVIKLGPVKQQET